MELFCFKMILLPCILLTVFFFGEMKANTIEVNRKNGLSFGDLYVPPGGIAECSRYGGVDFFSSSCQCKNAQGILGTFTDQCDYDLKTSSGCEWQIHQSNSPFYMDSATDILNKVFIGTDKTTFVTNCKDIAYLGAKIWENGKWNSFAADQFDKEKIGNQYLLKWINGQQPNTQDWTKYVGQLFRINLGCLPLEGNQFQPNCLLVKIKGKREYTTGNLPPTIPATTTSQHTKTGLTDQPATQTTTAPK
uniref:Cnidarian restricted protein n=2 Tax=Clytia hemisphaerica TaxID=252671 RepID=A0A7M5WL57_9CNID|eukprot:TCONS_00070175-protein